MGQIVHGLEELEKYQLAHGDLKSDNIMVDSNNNIVLIDFNAWTESFMMEKFHNIIIKSTGNGYSPTRVIEGLPPTRDTEIKTLLIFLINKVDIMILKQSNIIRCLTTRSASYKHLFPTDIQMIFYD